MTQSIRYFVAAAIAAISVGTIGCGGSGTTPAADGGAILADGGGNVADGGGVRADGGSRVDGGNNVVPCVLSDGGPVPECENLNVHSNDDGPTAKRITVGDVVDGVIGNASADAGDTDCYRLALTAGDVLRVKVEQRGGTDLVPYGALLDSEENSIREALPTTDPSVATRQMYISVTGTYYFCVGDARNAGAMPELVGGASYGYRLTTARETVTPTPVTLPVTARAGSTNATNDIQIFSFTATVGQRVHAEVRAARLAPPSDLDTILIMMKATGATPSEVAFNDDIDTMARIYDSAVDGTADAAGTYYIVLDHYWINSATDVPAVNYSLDIVNRAAGDGGA